MLTVFLDDGVFCGLIGALRDAYGKDIRIVGLLPDHLAAQQAMLDASYFQTDESSLDPIAYIIDICIRESVDFYFPVVTERLESVAEQAARIRRESGTQAIISPSLTVRICNNKLSLYEHLKKQGDPVFQKIIPAYHAVQTKSELLEAVKALSSSAMPCCIKPQRGEDAKGFWVIDDKKNDATLLFHDRRRDVISSALLGCILRQHAAEAIVPSLVMAYLPGEEWDCDLLCDRGRLVHVTPRINLRMKGGLSAVSETRQNPELEAICKRLAAELNLDMLSCASFIKDAGGAFRLTEINPRVMGNIHISHWAGNPYARMVIDMAQGHPMKPRPMLEGVRSSLYYDHQMLLSPNAAKKGKVT